MSGATLDRAIGRECEHEAAGERRADADPDRAEPEKRQATSTEVAQQHEEVPGRDRAKQLLQWPEDDGERPAREVDARLDLGLEAVRIEPRRSAVPELVAGEPELPDDLKMVAGSRCAGQAREPFGEEVRAGVPQRRPRREEAGGEVEG